MDSHTARGDALFNLGRYREAADAYLAHLGQRPDDGAAQAMLALCLAETGESREACCTAIDAAAKAPMLAMTHYAVAFVFFSAAVRSFAEEQDPRLRGAHAAITEALRLDPNNAGYFALLARILLQSGRRVDACNAALRGLALDPAQVDCATVLADGQRRLGYIADSDRTVAHALALEPSSAASHASRGETLVHQGRYAEACEAFLESLRLAPGEPYVRQALLNALRARWLPFRATRWLFTSVFSNPAEAAGLRSGAFVAIMMYAALASSFVAHNLITVNTAILVALLTFWPLVITPLLNFLVQLRAVGFHVLSQGERLIAALVAAAWFALVAAAAAYRACAPPWTAALAGAAVPITVAVIAHAVHARAGAATSLTRNSG